MKAVTWHGKRDVRVEDVADPKIKEPTDAIVRVTSSGICGSDLHLYEVLGTFMEEGDILGHEPLGMVTEVGSAVTNLAEGDRVVVPFNISCGDCFTCRCGLQSQCETTQVRDFGKGAALFGYTKLYGQVPGGQAEYLRVPQAHYGPIKVPEGPPDERFVYLSDVVPTAWQAVQYANIPSGGSVVVFGLGPIGQMCCRIAKQRGVDTVIGVDPVPKRRELAAAYGVTPVDSRAESNITSVVSDLTRGRGASSVIDAVGMEAHGAPIGKFAQEFANLLPKRIAEQVSDKASIDRLSVIYSAIDVVARGGTISLSGVYGGMLDPLPMLELFDKQITLHMGQANVRNWVDDLLPLVSADDDPLGVQDLATHKLPLEQAPHAYEIFQKKHDDAVKILLEPATLT